MPLSKQSTLGHICSLQMSKNYIVWSDKVDVSRRNCCCGIVVALVFKADFVRYGAPETGQFPRLDVGIE